MWSKVQSCTRGEQDKCGLSWDYTRRRQVGMADFNRAVRSVSIDFDAASTLQRLNSYSFDIGDWKERPQSNGSGRNMIPPIYAG